MTDQRFAVVATILRDELRKQVMSVDELARAIVAALDEHVTVTTAEGRRSCHNGAAKRIESGKDFRWHRDGDGDHYMRRNGRLYRLTCNGFHEWLLFCVDALGQRGVPAEPHVFRSKTSASEAIRAGKIKRPAAAGTISRRHGGTVTCPTNGHPKE